MLPRQSKTLVACESCRKRKTRCDGTRPMCSACGERGIESCVYASPRARAPSQNVKTSPEHPDTENPKATRGTARGPARMYPYDDPYPYGQPHPYGRPYRYDYPYGHYLYDERYLYRGPPYLYDRSRSPYEDHGRERPYPDNGDSAAAEPGRPAKRARQESEGEGGDNITDGLDGANEKRRKRVRSDSKDVEGESPHDADRTSDRDRHPEERIPDRESSAMQDDAGKAGPLRQPEGGVENAKDRDGKHRSPSSHDYSVYAYNPRRSRHRDDEEFHKNGESHSRAYSHDESRDYRRTALYSLPYSHSRTRDVYPFDPRDTLYHPDIAYARHGPYVPYSRDSMYRHGMSYARDGFYSREGPYRDSYFHDRYAHDYTGDRRDGIYGGVRSYDKRLREGSLSYRAYDDYYRRRESREHDQACADDYPLSPRTSYCVSDSRHGTPGPGGAETSATAKDDVLPPLEGTSGDGDVNMETAAVEVPRTDDIPPQSNTATDVSSDQPASAPNNDAASNVKVSVNNSERHPSSKADVSAQADDQQPDISPQEGPRARNVSGMLPEKQTSGSVDEASSNVQVNGSQDPPESEQDHPLVDPKAVPEADGTAPLVVESLSTTASSAPPAVTVETAVPPNASTNISVPKTPTSRASSPNVNRGKESSSQRLAVVVDHRRDSDPRPSSSGHRLASSRSMPPPLWSSRDEYARPSAYHSPSSRSRYPQYSMPPPSVYSNVPPARITSRGPQQRIHPSSADGPSHPYDADGLWCFPETRECLRLRDIDDRLTHPDYARGWVGWESGGSTVKRIVVSGWDCPQPPDTYTLAEAEAYLRGRQEAYVRRADTPPPGHEHLALPPPAPPAAPGSASVPDPASAPTRAEPFDVPRPVPRAEPFSPHRTRTAEASTNANDDDDDTYFGSRKSMAIIAPSSDGNEQENTYFGSQQSMAMLGELSKNPSLRNGHAPTRTAEAESNAESDGSAEKDVATKAPPGDNSDSSNAVQDVVDGAKRKNEDWVIPGDQSHRRYSPWPGQPGYGP